MIDSIDFGKGLSQGVTVNLKDTFLEALFPSIAVVPKMYGILKCVNFGLISMVN